MPDTGAGSHAGDKSDGHATRSQPHASHPGAGYICPICGVRPVETARKVWVLQGYILLARYGTRIIVGCCECVQRKVRLTLASNSMLGWWSFPWGLGTPFVIVQNLTQLNRAPNTELLAEVIALIEAEDTSIPEQVLITVAAVLAQGARDGGPGSREWRSAVQVLIEFSEGLLDEGAAESLLYQGLDGRFDVKVLTIEDREVLLRVVAEIALADGALTEAEMYYLRELCDRLNLRADVLDYYLSILASTIPSGAGSRRTTAEEPSAGTREEDRHAGQEESRARRAPNIPADVAAAFAVLGLPTDAPTVTIRARYRSLILQYHPDLVEAAAKEDATRRAAEINHAYDVLVRRAA